MLHIEPYNPMSVLVQSESRPDIKHLVDFEGFEDKPIACSCEASTLGGVWPCKHIIGISKMV